MVDKVEKAEVCVCTRSFCDEVPPLGDLRRNLVAVYASSIDGKRFNRTDVFFQNTDSNVKVDIDIELNTFK